MSSKRKALHIMRLKIHSDIVEAYRQHDLVSKMGWMGYYDPNDKHIKIDSELVGYDYEVTLIHECLEALWARLSFGQAVSDELKEVIIDNIAKMFVENFRIQKR
jgi:hypothetical protein